MIEVLTMAGHSNFTIVSTSVERPQWFCTDNVVIYDCNIDFLISHRAVMLWEVFVVSRKDRSFKVTRVWETGKHNVNFRFQVTMGNDL